MSSHQELEILREQSDAPTLLLMFILAFIFIFTMLFEELGRSPRNY